VTSLNVAGRDGRKLAPETLEAYRGLTVAGYPNLFLLLGPNTGQGHTSAVFMIESQIQHVLSCLRILAKDHAGTIEVSEAAQRRYNDALQRRLRRAVWRQGRLRQLVPDAGRGQPDAVAGLHRRVLGAHPPGAPRRLRRHRLMSADRPVVRRPDQVAGAKISPGVTVREMLNEDHGCRGLHQRRLAVAAGARLAGTAGGQGEAWYVITGTGFPGYRTGRVCRPRAGNSGVAGTRRRLCVRGRRAGDPGGDDPRRVTRIRTDPSGGPAGGTASRSAPGTGSSGCCSARGSRSRSSPA